MLRGIKYALDCIVVILWAVGICQEEIAKEKIRWVFAGLILAGIMGVPLLCDNEERAFFIDVILMTMVYFFIIKEKYIRKISIYLFSLFYVEILYSITELLVQIGVLWFKDLKTIFDVIGSILVAVCVIFISYKLKKKEKWIKNIKQISHKYYLLGFFCASAAVALNSYVGLEIVDENRNTQILILILTTVISVFFYIMGIMVVMMDSFRKYYKEQSLLKDQYLQLSKKHYESLSENIREVRGLRHDIKAHLNAVSYFIEKRDWDKLDEYVKDVNGAVNGRMEHIIDVNHDLVNAILIEALEGKENIVFQYEGILPKHLEIEDFDLCTIFSNLISNSVEACQKIAGGRKEIILEIKRFHSHLCICMKNPVQENIDIKKIGNWTSKNDQMNHGYGTYNVIRTVEKYCGEIKFYCEDQIFSVEIIFLNVIK